MTFLKQVVFTLLCFQCANVCFAKSLDLIPNDGSAKVGIYIGTFDPPHLSHLRIARAAIEKGYLDYVLFLPNDDAHHKPQAIPFHLRHHMSQVTVANFDRIVTPAIPSSISEGYVRDILIEMQQYRPNVKLVGMMGTDIAKIANEIFLDQKFWMGIVDSFLVNRREGYDANLIPHDIQGRRVESFESRDGGLSSTQMRKLVFEHKSSLYPYMDKAVVDLIEEYHLWSDKRSCRLLYLRPAL